ncbi:MULTISPECIES: YfhD family protein [unclassified Paenibacillus]|uniref:YfhD family protein n=1 Tax=unclassified Paenibacillus TaxID=185978 RepID=UPI0011A716CD|nr:MULTISPECIES: YfhD family protein [Paenibacillaceae]
MKERENPQDLQTMNDKNLPIARNEDVEFSRELADEDDLEALARAEAADERAES